MNTSSVKPFFIRKTSYNVIALVYDHIIGDSDVQMVACEATFLFFEVFLNAQRHLVKVIENDIDVMNVVNLIHDTILDDDVK